MRRHRLLLIAVLPSVVFLSLPCPAYAYIDPGTTGSVFAFLAPFLAIFVAFLGFLIRPFRRFIGSLLTKLRGVSGTTSDSAGEAAVSDNASDYHNHETSTGEESKN